MSGGVRVNRSVLVPEDELRYEYTPSGGPGGQHANKSSTRVVVVWNLEDSRALGPRQKMRVRGRLRHRIDSGGNVRLASGAQRSQLRNKEAVRQRLGTLLEAALRPEKKRVGTAPTRSSKENRLRGKRVRSEIKRGRRPPRMDD